MCFSVEINRDFKYLSHFFQAKIDKQAFYKLDERKKEMGHIYKTPAQDNRIYPNYYAPVVIGADKSQRRITPMRYRVRPHNSPTEVPSKYNLFNARYDSLTTRKTWKELIGRNHGLFPFKKFFEWVEVGGKKQLISFFPKGREIMWAPCIYDYWESPDKKYSITSFALITDDPPQEVLEKGHDRCPIFLKQDLWELWLNPGHKNVQEILGILKNKEEAIYQSKYLE
ncbi:MAG: SOS response-associated peptidase family protein [Bacteriovoracaceae bacterium]